MENLSPEYSVEELLRLSKLAASLGKLDLSDELIMLVERILDTEKAEQFRKLGVSR